MNRIPEWVGQGLTIAGTFFAALWALISTVGEPMVYRFLDKRYTQKEEVTTLKQELVRRSALYELLDLRYQQRDDAVSDRGQVTAAIEDLRCHMDERHDAASERIDEFKRELREDLRDLRNKLMERGHSR